jgi:hypothetical protein
MHDFHSTDLHWTDNADLHCGEISDTEFHSNRSRLNSHLLNSIICTSSVSYIICEDEVEDTGNISCTASGKMWLTPPFFFQD